LSILVFFVLTRETVQDPLVNQFDAAIVERIERLGYISLVEDRLNIYEDYPKALRRAPWIIVTGTGFQNINSVLGIAAHNNYVQALFELGIIGFLIYLRFLLSVLGSLRQAAQKAGAALERTLARDMWAAFVGVMATMLIGETLWAQYSMFTLTGQIMTLMALASSSLNWRPIAETEQDGEEIVVHSTFSIRQR
jgi:O-antigen ligase